MQPLWQIVQRFLKKLETELPYNPESLLLGIYLKEMKHSFIAALLTVAKETLPFVTIWIDLEGIILNETTQTQKGKYCTISFKCGISKKNLYKQRVK